ncbi:murein hydrolase activator EnvC family protein [Bacillus sp. REN16]|uniref:murein hydrolase activator EnvC family protein n=1 Tax=Bacillus sp. REN16 TaxID=2887296 RepID=UPI001E647C10|nr:peptidoglycan DD-metalloendopeptidase family protein [Bacillus sp. REN16]MCC3356382.1 peptidoglycan DD-metalloendopeptidase family protein [Bacillus sp. REN16]
MKRKLLMVGMGVSIGLGSLLTAMPNTALAIQTNEKLENEKKEVQEKKSELESEISQKENAIGEIKQQKVGVEQEIKRLDFAVNDTRSKIESTKAQIQETKEEIERLEAEMKVLEERIQKRDELIKERMRSLQQSGGVVSYVDVLLGAKSFNDFINRISAVSAFVQADREIMKEHEADIKLLEANKAEVHSLLAQQEDQLKELDRLEVQLQAQIKEQNKVMAQLEAEEQKMHEELHSLEDVGELLAAQEKAIQMEINAWNQRQAELEEQRRKAEEERIRSEEERKKAEAEGKTPPPLPDAPPPVVNNGSFMNPTTGRLTSGFGMRWGKMHFGIDIGKGGRVGNVLIYAAASGTITRSRLESSYGNVIMITHYINGRQMTTVYAHLDQRFVNQYDRVEQGQLIGFMGNTGDSTGPHLHFEIYDGPYSPTQYSGGHSNAVNPLQYVSF